MQYTSHIISRSFLLIIAFSALFACSSMTVTTDWDQDVDFSDLKTFTLIESTQPSTDHQVAHRIRTAIVGELTARGLMQVDNDNKADLAIGYEIATEQRRTYHNIHSGFRGRGFRTVNVHMRGPTGVDSTRPINFTVGTLIISVFKVDDKLLIWEGSANDVVNSSSGPEQSIQQINDAIQKILQGFPPGDV